MEQSYHQSVLIKEVLNYLDPKEGDLVVDCTFGFGGHSAEILKKIGPSGRIIGIEQDDEIYKKVRGSLDKRIELVNDNFINIVSILKDRKIDKVDRILFDLGLSSYHYDELGLGFSFKDESLDMRLDRFSGDTAADIVNYMKESELADLIYQYGEEYKSRRIAKAIVDARRKKKIESARELSQIISAAAGRSGRINPATKTFQALRIAVNNELTNLERVISEAVDLLEEGGRIAIISFHSLEDRIVKKEFLKLQSENKITIISKKPLVASYAETRENPRSRSAKLRVAERITGE